MELTNEFTVAVPPERAWEILTDVELIAPCLPGAQLTEIDGETYKGKVKVKVGPVTAEYKGTAHFVEKDDVNHKAVLEGTGRDSRGAGNASATVTALITPDGDGSKVNVTTELKVTGKVAQFGRGVMADVSNKLLGQFVECLEVKVITDEGPAPAEAAPEEAAPAAAEPKPAAPAGPRKIDMPEAEPVDLFDTAGAPVIKRAIPVAIVLLLLLLLLRRRRTR